jgi:hypothetical protein
MPKKVVKKKEAASASSVPTKLYVSSMTLQDLRTAFEIVSADFNATGGSRNQLAKNIIAQRYAELKKELYGRIYGCDPFSVTVEMGEAEGESPEVVLEKLTKSQQMVKDAKTSKKFVVEKNPEPKEEG